MVVGKKYLIACWFSFACVFLAVFLFFYLCWTASIDAQGAVAFVIYAPVLGTLLFGGYYLGKIASKEVRVATYGTRSSLTVTIFVVLFYLLPFFGLGHFSDAVIRSFSKAFEKVAWGPSKQ